MSGDIPINFKQQKQSGSEATVYTNSVISDDMSGPAMLGPKRLHKLECNKSAPSEDHKLDKEHEVKQPQAKVKTVHGPAGLSRSITDADSSVQSDFVCNEQEIYVNLKLPRQQFLKWYQGLAKTVTAKSLSGLRVVFPANILLPFVTNAGVSGIFRIEYDHTGRFQDITKVG